jgi:hypothetical protein
LFKKLWIKFIQSREKFLNNLFINTFLNLPFRVQISARLEEATGKEDKWFPIPMKGCGGAGRKANPKFGDISIHRCVHSASRDSSKAVDGTATTDRKEKMSELFFKIPLLC